MLVITMPKNCERFWFNNLTTTATKRVEAIGQEPDRANTRKIFRNGRAAKDFKTAKKYFEMAAGSIGA
jgi:hypothetical protein